MSSKLNILLITAVVMFQGCASTEVAEKRLSNEGIIKVSVHYFPPRGSDALKLAAELRENGYLTSVMESGTSSSAGKSYMYIQKEDFKSARKIINITKSTLGHDLGTYFSKKGNYSNAAIITLKLNDK